VSCDYGQCEPNLRCLPFHTHHDDIFRAPWLTCVDRVVLGVSVRDPAVKSCYVEDFAGEIVALLESEFDRLAIWWSLMKDGRECHRKG